MQDIIPSLMSAEDALALRKTHRTLFVDATFHLPTSGRNAAQEFLDKHIAGAVRFDLDMMSDQTAPFPHTMPSPEDFARAMRLLGADNEDHIIVYDNSVFLSCARAWWMLRFFGHSKVSILNGGLKAWAMAGGQTEAGESIKPEGNFTAHMTDLKRAAIADVQAALGDKGAIQIIDARGPARFSGAEPEPRAGMASGHIPGSINLPVTQLLQDGFLRPLDEIRSIVTEAQISPQKPIITTCGSGVTACGLAFAFYLLGINDVAVYDGSWAEWGHQSQDRDACPVATQP